MVTQFVNNMMYDGKKSTAFKIFYDALEIVESRVEETSALDVWRKAVQNITPAVEVRSRRIGGATFQIPQPIRDARKLSMAMKWMIGYARKRNDKNMSHKLAAEIVAAFKEEGAAYKKKQDTHRMAEANKAFSHFRF
jgi:small subunit ribosomal protein S7